MSRALGRLASRLGAVPGVRAASWARPGQPSPFRPVPAPALPRRGLLDHKPLEEYGEYANRIIDGKGISDQMLHDIGEKVPHSPPFMNGPLARPFLSLVLPQRGNHNATCNRMEEGNRANVFPLGRVNG